jgi:hypothetical protein
MTEPWVDADRGSPKTGTSVSARGHLAGLDKTILHGRASDRVASLEVRLDDGPTIDLDIIRGPAEFGAHFFVAFLPTDSRGLLVAKGEDGATLETERFKPVPQLQPAEVLTEEVIDEYKITVSYPRGWNRAPEPLAAGLPSGREILSVGTYRLRGGSPGASLLLAACGGLARGPRGGGLGNPTDPGGPGSKPPPVTVRSPNRSFHLAPYTYCYGTVCADGFPPANLPDVGSPEQVVVEAPLPGWSFTASFRPAGEERPGAGGCLEPAAEGTWILRPAGHAGPYDVDLFGKGDGDLFVTFRWTTPEDGPLPRPEARLAVLGEHDGESTATESSSR